MSVLEKASDLIDCLGQAGEPVTLGHVRSALAMPKSSTHRLLSELAALGIVRHTEDGRYSLGPRLLYWGEAAAETFDLRAIAEPTMRRLRDEVGRVSTCTSGTRTPGSASRPSRHGTSCAHSSNSDAHCRFELGQPARSCWPSPRRMSSGRSSRAPPTTASVCRTPPARTWLVSLTSCATNGGRLPSGNGRTGWRPSPPR